MLQRGGFQDQEVTQARCQTFKQSRPVCRTKSLPCVPQPPPPTPPTHTQLHPLSRTRTALHASPTQGRPAQLKVPGADTRLYYININSNSVSFALMAAPPLPPPPGLHYFWILLVVRNSAVSHKFLRRPSERVAVENSQSQLHSYLRLMSPEAPPRLNFKEHGATAASGQDQESNV